MGGEGGRGGGRPRGGAPQAPYGSDSEGARDSSADSSARSAGGDGLAELPEIREDEPLAPEDADVAAAARLGTSIPISIHPGAGAAGGRGAAADAGRGDLGGATPPGAVVGTHLSSSLRVGSLRRAGPPGRLSTSLRHAAGVWPAGDDDAFDARDRAAEGGGVAASLRDGSFVPPHLQGAPLGDGGDAAGGGFDAVGGGRDPLSLNHPERGRSAADELRRRTAIMRATGFIENRSSSGTLATGAGGGAGAGFGGDGSDGAGAPGGVAVPVPGASPGGGREGLVRRGDSFKAGEAAALGLGPDGRTAAGSFGSGGLSRSFGVAGGLATALGGPAGPGGGGAAGAAASPLGGGTGDRATVASLAAVAAAPPLRPPGDGGRPRGRPSAEFLAARFERLAAEGAAGHDDDDGHVGGVPLSPPQGRHSGHLPGI